MSTEHLDGGEHAPDPFTAAKLSDHPSHVIALVLELSHLRASHLVGRALADLYPTDALWTHALERPDFFRLVEEFSQVMADVRTTLESAEPTPDAVSAAVGQHYERALQAVHEFAERIGVDGADLIRVLVHIP